MATATKKCKVCDSQYEYCHTLKSTAGVFRWQDVACCPEHGSIYLARIKESRRDKPVENTEVSKGKKSNRKNVTDICDIAEHDGGDKWLGSD